MKQRLVDSAGMIACSPLGLHVGQDIYTKEVSLMGRKVRGEVMSSPNHALLDS